MYKHILIPTDGSESSERAAQAAVALAQAFRARLTGAHILPRHLGRIYGDLAWVDERRDMQMREVASGYLDRIAAAAKGAGVAFEPVLQSGEPVWRAILQVAEDKGCDLIVMAAHGWRGIAALVLGSETSRVLIHAKVPVLVCR